MGKTILAAAACLAATGAAATAALAAEPVDRFPVLTLEQMNPAQRKVADAIASGPRGRLSGPFNTWLRSPELADRLQKVGEQLRFRSSLPGHLNEFAILITGREWSAGYEWYAHHSLAMKAGLKPEIAADLKAGRRPAAMSEDEAVIYDFSTQLHRNKQVSDAVYSRMVKRFGEAGAADLIALNGYYVLVSMTLNVARVQAPVGSSETLPEPPIPTD